MLLLEKILQITIRRIGNSKGVVLPKSILTQAGFDDQNIAILSVENDAIVLRKAANAPRVGWAEAALALTARSGNENELLMGEFGNVEDVELRW